MSTNRSLAERLFAAFLSLVLVLGMFPVGAVRTSAEETAVSYGSVTPLTQGLSVSGSGTQKVDITNGDITLQWSPADASIGRYQDGWWVGIKVNAPAGMTAEQLQNVKYGYTAETLDKSFWSNKDSADDAQSHYITMWGITNKEYLDAGMVTYNWYFSWDGTNVQHVQLNLDPAKVVLKDAQGNGVYPVYGNVDAYTQGLSVAGNGSEAVVVSNGNITLDWVAADESIGRVQDGWWVGVKVTAPAGLTEEQLKNATYGRTPNALTGSFWNDQNSAPNAQVHYIDLWILVNETKLEQNKLNYDFYFCWDGTSVQHVQLNLDPAKVVLKDAQGNNVYPVYGTVAAISPADAVISGTDSAITVAVEKAELIWVEADEKLGREAGWWVGIKAIAPEGFSENAQYAYVTNGVIGEAKSFKTYKDGDDYIELWLMVTDEKLVKDEDRKLTMNYAFDWNGNGIYEQTIEFYVNADGNIVLNNAAGQQVYPYFYGEVSTDITTAQISQNKTAEVTVDLNGYEIQWNNGWEASVKVSLAGYEDVTITQTFQSVEETKANTTCPIDWNGDGLTDQTVILTGNVKLKKAEQKKPKLEKESVGIDSRSLHTDGGSNAVTNADEAVGALSYTIAENDYLTVDAATGKITVKDGQWKALLKELGEKKSFEVEVTATFAETDTHTASSASYTLTLNPKTDASLSFAKNDVAVVYGGADGNTFTYTQIPTSENGEIDTITYASSDESVAKVAADGVVSFVKAGDATITATVTYKAGFTTRTVSYDLSISKGEQKPLTFENSKLEITYNDEGNKYVSAAVGGTTGNAVVYQLIAGEGVAEIADAGKPELTIKTSGTVTVQATMPGNDCYNPVSATYTLTINKAEQKIALEKTSDTKDNSQKEYPIVMVPQDGWYSQGEDFKFEVVKQDATITEDTFVNETTGVVTIGEADYGTLEIKVTRPGDDCFLQWPGETFTLTIEQIDADSANFSLSGEKKVADGQWYSGPVTITYADGVAYQVSDVHEKNDKWADSYTISDDGLHKPVLSVQSTADHGGTHYALNVGEIRIDQTAPKTTITYADTVWGRVFENLTFGFYDAPTVVIITGDDTNGEAEVSGIGAIYYKLEGEEAFTAGTLVGNSIEVRIEDQYIGKVEFYAVDKAGNVEDKNISGTTIVVDTSAATWTEKYAYDFDEAKDTGKAVYTDANGVQYTRFDTTVTLTVTEKFFDLSLAELQLTENGTASAAAPEITGDDSRSEWTKDENGNWNIDLTLNTEGVHDMSMVYQNRSKLDSAKYSQKIVIDRTVPVCEIEWVEAERVVEGESGNTRYYKENAEKPATATLIIKDANFDPAQVVVTDKSKLFDGTEKEEVLPATWTQDAEDSTVWTATVTLTAEGVHNLSVDCTDWAGNVMETKTTDVVVIDYTAPVIKELFFSGAEVVNTVEGRNYYSKPVTVTLTITERNFDENDVEIALKALDVTGEAVKDASYTSEKGWEHNGDEHTIELVFAADANYALDVSYSDMADNAGNDVEEKLFTVDQVAPEIVGITYSKSLQDIVIEKITFSYYRAPVEVTLKVKDVTAGVQQFDYSALLNAGVSPVNAAIENQTATNVTQDGTNFYVTFKIPAEALTDKNQFNGYVQFTAKDWSGNVSAQETHKEKQSVVVDNITPKVTVTYNAPVQRVNDVSYYDGNITVTIAIDEANFFDEDVQVTVTRDGANYPVNVTWTGGNGDIHTGIFGLAQDGDYIVNIQYTDRSGNEMTEYTSNQLTLDTTLPTVEVTNVVANSANTDEVYTFDITASDINIDVATFKPVLTGVFRDEDGTFHKKTIDMGAVKVVKKDETYTFTVENLEEDAIYTLTCSVKDLAGNTYEKMVLKDEKEYDEVQFSINRNGSTYMLDDTTMELVGNYYVQNVNNDVVLIEINPDVLENHSVSLNGKDLQEGEDYKVTSEGGDGSWMKYTYSVDKDVMADESEYLLVVSSEDKAGNKAFSDVKGASINFVVDRTAPVVTVTGMHNDGRYQVESQTVTLIPMDAGGALNSLSVYLVDDDGNVLQELVNLSGEDLYNALEAGDDQITFEIGEGLYQNVRVVCTDLAVDADGATNAYDETFTNISVSTSAFMIFWANKGLRYGVIFGLLGLIALIVFLILGKKKKK